MFLSSGKESYLIGINTFIHVRFELKQLIVTWALDNWTKNIFVMPNYIKYLGTKSAINNNLSGYVFK